MDVGNYQKVCFNHSVIKCDFSPRRRSDGCFQGAPLRTHVTPQQIWHGVRTEMEKPFEPIK